MILPILDMAGRQVDTFEVPAAWLEAERGGQAVHDSVVAFLAGNRSGSACVKNRAKVRASNAKPYRQKGTGRARAGRTSSPIWRGGGTVFGPSPRSYAKKLNKRVRRLALKRSLTDRIAERSVWLVDAIRLEAPRTRDMVAFLRTLGTGEDKVLLVVDQLEENAVLAARNLPDVELMRAGAVNVYWLLYFKCIVFTKAGLEAFGARLAPTEVVSNG